MLPALKHRNYKIYISGQFVSLIGTWMQQLAMSWMVYRLTNSAFWLGISGFASQIPIQKGILIDQNEDEVLLKHNQALKVMAKKRFNSFYETYLVQVCKINCELQMNKDIKRYWKNLIYRKLTDKNSHP